MSPKHSQRPPWLGEDDRGWDHVRIHIQLMQDPRLGANELAVYMGIAVHAELTTGAARPSKSTLGRYANLSDRAVYNALTKLTEAGYVAVDQRPGLASTYHLLPPPTDPGPRQDVPPSDPTPAPHAGHPGTTCPTTPAPRADELEPGDESQERENPSGAPAPLLLLTEADVTAGSADPTFDRFWEAWPERNGRKLGRKQARQKWDHLTIAQRLLALRGAIHYADASRRRLAGAMDAFRWLRDQLWEDWQDPIPANVTRSSRRGAAPPATRQVMTDRGVSGRWTPTGRR